MNRHVLICPNGRAFSKTYSKSKIDSIIVQKLDMKLVFDIIEWHEVNFETSQYMSQARIFTKSCRRCSWKNISFRSSLRYHTLIFNLMNSRNMYLYNAYFYTYILFQMLIWEYVWHSLRGINFMKISFCALKSLCFRKKCYFSLYAVKI